MKKLYLSTLFFSYLLAIDVNAVKNEIAPETPGLLEQRLKEDLIKNRESNKAIIEKIKLKENNASKTNQLKVPSFILRGVSISGITVFKKSDIAPILKEFINKRVTSKDIKLLANKITKLYYSHGYVTSKCIIPPQKVKNGIIHLKVIENVLSNILLEGSNIYDYNSNFFMKYLYNLKGKILNIKTLNSALEILSNLPATKIVPTIKKINDKYSILIIKIISSNNNFNVSIDNKGSKYTGIYRIHFNGSITNIRGRSDVLNILTTFTTHPKYLSSVVLNYISPYGKEGAKLSYLYSYMDYQLDPDQVGSDLVIYQGNSSDFSITYSKPIIGLKNNWKIVYFYGFDKKHVVSQTIENATGEVLVNGVDNIFTLQGGVNFIKLDTLFRQNIAINTFSFKIIKALEGVFGSMTKEDLKRKENDNTFPITGPIKYGSGLDPSFVQYYYSFSRKQHLPNKYVLSLSLNGCYTNDRVPNSFEYSGGDYGWGWSVSLSKPIKKVNTSFSVSASTVYTRETDGSITVTENKPGFSISASTSYKKFSLSASYSSSFEKWDSNHNNIKFTLKYSY